MSLSANEDVIELNKLERYHYQVAGHRCCITKEKTSMLKWEDDKILKPLMKEDRGTRELNFYVEINSNNCDPVISELRSFTPAFYGKKTIRVDKNCSVNYLVLEDLTKGLGKPCIIDVKMGKRTWDLVADEAKVASETEKYALSKNAFGFCILGYSVFDLKDNKWIKFDKEEARKLNKETLPTALQTFLNVGYGAGHVIISEIIQKLQSILKWFEQQRKYRFFASSLLIIYDADRFLDSNFDENRSWCQVKMIDFAHTFRNTTEAPLDENYIHGLHNLISLLSNIKIRRTFCGVNLTTHEEPQSHNRDDTSEIKEKILHASLRFVPDLGWSKNAIIAGAESLNYPGIIHGMFSSSGYDLVHHFYQKSNKQLIESLENKSMMANIQKFPADFIHDAIRIRLLMIEPYLSKWPQALALMSLPANVTTSLANLLTLIDDICYYAGDRSVNINWYARRLAIAAIYKTTELYFIQDDSNNFQNTWIFLSNRISEVHQLHQIVKTHENLNSRLEHTFTSAFITARNILGMNR